jgi:hypothetical protein
MRSKGERPSTHPLYTCKPPLLAVHLSFFNCPWHTPDGAFRSIVKYALSRELD